MTTPRHGLRAHNGRWTIPGSLCERLQGGPKEFRLHVVRISAETRILPALIDGVLFGFPQAAKLRLVNIGDSGLFDRPVQGMRVILRIMAGPWNRPHVDEARNAVGFEKCQELVDGLCRVTDGPESHPLRYHTGWTIREGKGRSYSGGIFLGSTSSSFSRPLPACSVLYKRSPTWRLPISRLPVATKVKSPREGGLKEPRITAVSLKRDTVEKMSSSWRFPSKKSTATRGCGLAVASFRICSNWTSNAMSRSRSTQGFR